MNKKDLVKIEYEAKRMYDESKNYFDTNLKKVYEYYWNMFKGTRKKMPNAAQWRNNKFIKVTFADVQTEMSRFMDGLYGPDGTKFYKMNAKTIKNEDSAEIITRIKNQHMIMGDFYQVNYAAALNAHIFGVGAVKQEWDYSKVEFDYMKTTGDKRSNVHKKVQNDRPKWTAPSAMDVWYDPNGSPLKGTLTYVCERQYIRTSQIQEQEYMWNIKENYEWALNESKNKQVDLTMDDAQEIVHVYTKKGITTLWYNKAIRYIENPFSHGNIPFYFIVRYPDFYRFGGIGIAGLLGDLNESINDVFNLTMDNLFLSINKGFLKRRDAYISPQALNFEPGKVISLEDIEKDFKVLDMGDIHMETFKMLDTLNGFVNQTTGSLDYMNSPSGIGNTNKTATGARIIVQEANRRFAMAIKYNKESFLCPMLRDLGELYKQYVNRKKVISVLGEDILKEYKMKWENIDWDGEYDYEITGNVSLLDKQAILDNLEQAMPLLSQLGVSVNKIAIAGIILDALDVPKDIIQQQHTQQVGPDGQPMGANGPIVPQNGATKTPTSSAQTQPNAVPAEQLPPQGAGVQLTPQQEDQLTQIAQILGATPELLKEDLASGKVDFQTLVLMAEKAQQQPGQ